MKDLRHACIENQKACFATPDASNLVGFHGHTPLCPLDRIMILLRSPANNIVCRDIVVPPNALQIDGDNSDHEHGLSKVSEDSRSG